MKTQTIGLAYRAKKLILGTEFVIEQLRLKKLKLILLANDASALTKKKILDKAKHYVCCVCQDYSSNDLSKALGGKNVKVIGILDEGFAKLLIK